MFIIYAMQLVSYIVLIKKVGGMPLIHQVDLSKSHLDTKHRKSTCLMIQLRNVPVPKRLLNNAHWWMKRLDIERHAYEWRGRLGAEWAIMNEVVATDALMNKEVGCNERHVYGEWSGRPGAEWANMNEVVGLDTRMNQALNNLMISRKDDQVHEWN